jgi:hypothetical protein
MKVFNYSTTCCLCHWMFLLHLLINPVLRTIVSLETCVILSAAHRWRRSCRCRTEGGNNPFRVLDFSQFSSEVVIDLCLCDVNVESEITDSDLGKDLILIRE